MNSSSKVVIFIFALAAILSSACVAAARPLHGERRPRDHSAAIESLQRGPVPPSTSSACTNIPGGGGGGRSCPLNERNFAGRVARHNPPVLHPRAV
ncbi:uncharacterized protein J3R85_001628 [Psidium guajava]|nr:uncharacterized protein J3R85_001628 [Psidium guajava]